MGGGINPPPEVLQQWAKIANPEHPSQTRGWGLVILCVVLFTFALAVVVARLWARLMIRRTAGIDDIVIVLAMIPTAGLALSTALASRLYGFNRHAWDLTPELAQQSRKLTLVMEVTYMASTCLTKISILLFYRRMSDGAISSIFRTIGYISIASVVAYMFAFSLAGVLGCRPISAYWLQVDLTWASTHPRGKSYQCINEGAMILSACAVSIVQDFLACGLPLPLFWKLQLPKRQRIALAAIFSVGFFLCITGCLRLYYVHKIYYTTYDVTWVAWDAWIWTVIEAHLAIICSSAPALKTFFKRYLGSLSLTGASSWTRRQRTYGRKTTGFSAHHHSGLATSSTTNLDGGHGKAYELGGISVTKAVEIETRSVPMIVGEKSAKSSLSEEERISHSPDPTNRSPWLYVDPPKPHQNV
ncbi:hypothetical protein, variant [Verruconis gallopava]|uniref:Rhodopsin domain-containing protein n=1 Tax=Verruconis gallopava TaxID=253628 RepID=A0A0D1XUB3_9PEZI|nr:uncharacterized protein PV09_02803 [Verruconis gallopava]XP_016216210.1 hypothetical protein, variant [Verruconis gallopava]KIW06340.1 hypothetical protein PV09_02803 [Verruconis gallopava]KIW06341.1 hypothetical protein, variant [Verruconis gallopava]